MSAEIGVFAAIRIVAVGLVVFGWRLRNAVYPEARLAGGLILTLGALLFGGLIELI